MKAVEIESTYYARASERNGEWKKCRRRRSPARARRRRSRPIAKGALSGQRGRLARSRACRRLYLEWLKAGRHGVCGGPQTPFQPRIPVWNIKIPDFSHALGCGARKSSFQRRIPTLQTEIPDFSRAFGCGTRQRPSRLLQRREPDGSVAAHIALVPRRAGSDTAESRGSTRRQAMPVECNDAGVNSFRRRLRDCSAAWFMTRAV